MILRELIEAPAAQSLHQAVPFCCWLAFKLTDNKSDFVNEATTHADENLRVTNDRNVGC